MTVVRSGRLFQQPAGPLARGKRPRYTPAAGVVQASVAAQGFYEFGSKRRASFSNPAMIKEIACVTDHSLMATGVAGARRRCRPCRDRAAGG
jgi:hypothetical protein